MTGKKQKKEMEKKKGSGLWLGLFLIILIAGVVIIGIFGLYLVAFWTPGILLITAGAIASVLGLVAFFSPIPFGRIGGLPLFLGGFVMLTIGLVLRFILGGA